MSDNETGGGLTDGKNSFFAMKVKTLPLTNPMKLIYFQNPSDRARIANELLSDMMTLAEGMYGAMGADEEEMRDLKRKRSAITACYFQAVSCY